MNKNIFVSILLIIFICGLIAVTVTITQYKEDDESKIVYSEVPSNNYKEDFSINNYTYSTVNRSHFYKYHSFIANINEDVNEPFINEAIVETTELSIGDEIFNGDVLGIQNMIELKSEHNGVVLDIIDIDAGKKIIYTNQKSLTFVSEFSQSENYLLSYDMKVEIKLDNNRFVSAKVLKIDYENIQNAKITVTFEIPELKANLFPNYSVEARIMIEDVGEKLFIPLSFFENYTLIKNKSFEVYYIDDENTLKSITIKTEEIYGDKVVLNDNNISEGLTFYMKPGE